MYNEEDLENSRGEKLAVHTWKPRGKCGTLQYMLGDYNTAHFSRVQYKQYGTWQEITAQHIIVEYNTDSTVHDRRLQYCT